MQVPKKEAEDQKKHRDHKSRILYYKTVIARFLQKSKEMSVRHLYFSAMPGFHLQTRNRQTVVQPVIGS